MSSAEDTTTDPSDWPNDDMGILDQELRCTICKEFFTTPMLLTSCSHTFCSFCIRKSLEFDQHCPVCRESADPLNLKPNRILESIVGHFVKVRAKLIDVFKRPTRKSVTIYSSEEETSETSNKHTIPSSQAISPLESKLDHIIETPVSLAECPICYCFVKIDDINEHIDSGCNAKLADSKSEASSSSSSSASSSSSSSSSIKQSVKPIKATSNTKSTANDEKRKPLAKVAYDVLKEYQIKNLLTKHGLRTTGDRAALIRRHKEFVRRYNASCDSLAPKAVKTIIREIDEEEEQIEKEKRRTAKAGKAPDLIAGNADDLAEAHRKEHKQQFDVLIEQARQSIYRTASSTTNGGDSHPDQTETVVIKQRKRRRRSELIKDVAEEDDDDNEPNEVPETDDDSDFQPTEVSAPRRYSRLHKKRRELVQLADDNDVVS